MSLLVRRTEGPSAPTEIADEVEMWARQYGRHATLKFIPTLFHGGRVLRGAWVVRLTLRSNDKRMKAYREGMAPEPPTEDVWLHVRNPEAGKPIGSTGLKEPPYVGLDLVHLGAGGVRQFLEKGDTWSGRGEYRSLQEQVRQVRNANEGTRAKFRAEQKELNRYEQRDQRRQRFKIPFIPVSVPFGRKRSVNRSTP